MHARSIFRYLIMRPTDRSAEPHKALCPRDDLYMRSLSCLIFRSCQLVMKLGMLLALGPLPKVGATATASRCCALSLAYTLCGNRGLPLTPQEQRHEIGVCADPVGAAGSLK